MSIFFFAEHVILSPFAERKTAIMVPTIFKAALLTRAGCPARNAKEIRSESTVCSYVRQNVGISPTTVWRR